MTRPSTHHRENRHLGLRAPGPDLLPPPMSKPPHRFPFLPSSPTGSIFPSNPLTDTEIRTSWGPAVPYAGAVAEDLSSVADAVDVSREEPDALRSRFERDALPLLPG